MQCRVRGGIIISQTGHISVASNSSSNVMKSTLSSFCTIPGPSFHEQNPSTAVRTNVISTNHLVQWIADAPLLAKNGKQTKCSKSQLASIKKISKTIVLGDLSCFLKGDPTINDSPILPRHV